MREDLRLKEVAEARGFSIELHVLDRAAKERNTSHVPYFPLVFKKGDWTAWRTGQGWRTAKLEASNYTGHKSHDSLFGALYRINKEVDNKEKN